MTALAIAAGVVGVVVAVALWDACRRALAAQVAMAQARVDGELSERLDAMQDRVASLERSQRDAVLGRGRR